MDVRNLIDIPEVGDVTCGRFKPLYESSEGNCSLVYFEISSSTIPHKHERMTEMYFIHSGAGIMRIGNESMLVRSGDRIIIPKGEIHQIIPTFGSLEMEVLADPKFDPSDIIESPDFYNSK